MMAHLTGLFAILILSGCTTNVLVKLEDGRSGKPLEDVTVQWSELKYFGIVDVKEIQHPVSKTGTNGVVEIHEIRKRNRSHSLVFQKEGYHRASLLMDFRDPSYYGIFSPLSTNGAPSPDAVPVPFRTGTTVIRIPLHEKR